MSFEYWRQHPLIGFIRKPEVALGTFGPLQWSCLIGTARRANLMSRLASTAAASGQDDALPVRVVEHFASARRVSQSARTATLREARHIVAALEPAGVPVVFLKGAAYILAGLDAGNGRLLGDVDILVPRDQIEVAERALVAAGWMTTKIDNYDQRYYRQWMHELPPMRHLDRGTNLDVHHSILPPTARLKPDPALLWDTISHPAEALGAGVLSDVDLVLHSATHLFHEGEFDNGLRDLVDLHVLLVEFGGAGEDAFWLRLLARARQLDLLRPLYYALRFSCALFDTPIPGAVLIESAAKGPDSATARLMDAVLLACLTSTIAPARGPGLGMALLAAFVRSHYLRMPTRLLVPHLARKLVVPERG